MGALGAAALVVACAGELDQPPDSFTNAFATGTGGTTATGGSSTGGGITTGGAAGTTGGGSSTGGSATGGGGAVPPDDACVAGVFSSQGCSTSCHTTAAIGIPALSAGMALDGANVGARLVTHKSTGTCTQGAFIIDTMTPSNSILLKKVTAKHACGDSMPQGGVGLTGTNLQCITDWVNKF